MKWPGHDASYEDILDSQQQQTAADIVRFSRPMSAANLHVAADRAPGRKCSPDEVLETCPASIFSRRATQPT